MALFGFKRTQGKTVHESTKLKSSCECGNECSISDIKKSRIIVLGACCKKSADTFENVKTAVLEMEINENVINVGDLAEIAKYGVMSTPALVIDSKVVSMGKLISINYAKQLIEKAGF